MARPARGKLLWTSPRASCPCGRELLVVWSVVLFNLPSKRRKYGRGCTPQRGFAKRKCANRTMSHKSYVGTLEKHVKELPRACPVFPPRATQLLTNDTRHAPQRRYSSYFSWHWSMALLCFSGAFSVVQGPKCLQARNIQKQRTLHKPYVPRRRSMLKALLKQSQKHGALRRCLTLASNEIRAHR